MARPVPFICAKRGWIPLALVCAFSAAAPAAQASDSTSAPTLPLDIPQLHSDIKFLVLAPGRKEPTDSEREGGLYQQTTRVAEALQKSARSLYPEQMQKLGKFDIYIGDAGDPGTISSASGRISLNTGFADLKPADAWLAFVIAREMGHILAGHHDRNSMVSMIASALLSLIIPGSLIIRQALSFGGSQVASLSGRPEQGREADEIALKLMEGAGYSSTSLALNLAFGPTNEQLGTGMWASDFVESAEQVITKSREARVAAAKLVKAPAANIIELISPPANATELISASPNSTELISASPNSTELISASSNTTELISLPANTAAELISPPANTPDLIPPPATTTELIPPPELAVALQQ